MLRILIYTTIPMYQNLNHHPVDQLALRKEYNISPLLCMCAIRAMHQSSLKCMKFAERVFEFDKIQ